MVCSMPQNLGAGTDAINDESIQRNAELITEWLNTFSGSAPQLWIDF